MGGLCILGPKEGIRQGAVQKIAVEIEVDDWLFIEQRNENSN